MAEDSQAGDGDEADLVVAVVIRMTAAFIKGAVHPAALCYAGVEQVVALYAEIDLLQETFQPQRIAE